MKKINGMFLLKTAFLLAFCLFVYACKQNGFAGRVEFADVTISIGGLQGENQHTRSIGENGLPDLTAEDTAITITATYNGTTKTEKAKALTLKEVPMGTEIDIKVKVETAYASWEGEKKHTVIDGENKIDIKLSKTAKSASNFLMSFNSNSHKAVIRLGDKTVFDDTIQDQPYTARDGLGRLYLMYQEAMAGHDATVITRFTVEGERDTAFEEAVKKVLPARMVGIRAFAVDFKTGDIFWLEHQNLHCVTKNGNAFTCLKYDTQGAREFFAFAAIDGKLFCIERAHASNDAPKLKAYRVSADFIAKTLNLEPLPGEAEAAIAINGLSGAPGIHRYTLFADDKGIYCLQSLFSLMDWGNLYSVGKLLHYEYDGSAFTLKKEVGLNPNALAHNALPYHGYHFSNPIAFIGFDAQNIYIADDGINIAEVNENYRIVGNKNRIAAFNRATGNLSFSNTDATWLDERPVYKFPETPVLLWEKASGLINYWTSTDGTESFNATNKLFKASASTIKPTDVFSYDQDGNLYILWQDGSNGYKVRRFVVKEDGTYDTAGVDMNSVLTVSTPPISAIAVDISDGKNYLYYNDTANTVKRFTWDDSGFSAGTQETEYGITTPTRGKITALAANKDGVFVGIKETYKDSSIDKYRLKVLKYEKTGNPANQDSEITLVDDAVSYTDTVEPPSPIADPNPDHDPNAPCNQYQEAINGLQIGNGMLYGISAKLHRKWLLSVVHVYSPDVFKHSSILYKIGSTAKALPNRPLAKEEKPVDDTNKVGYGFYRFIAVKYDEAERIRLIIASDSAWGKDGCGLSSSPPAGDNTDKIVEFNLKDMLFREVKRSEDVFSKRFNTSGFSWD